MPSRDARAMRLCSLVQLQRDDEDRLYLQSGIRIAGSLQEANAMTVPRNRESSFLVPTADREKPVGQRHTATAESMFFQKPSRPHFSIFGTKNSKI